MDLSKSYEYFQPEKLTDRVHIIGCGSVGSTVAENLARSGVTKFTLWDFDVVEPHNLANQMFRQKDIGKAKVDALLDILCEINEEVKDNTQLKTEGWKGQQLNGFVFLCVDNIDLRREIVQKHMDSPYIKAMFDWTDFKMKKDFLASMNFSHDEAKEETPVSACNVTLSVAPTVRIICAYGVANFMNFWNGKPLKKLILADAFGFVLDAF